MTARKLPETGVAHSIDFSTADPDTVLDLDWLEEHRERRYYAHQVLVAGTTWTALIYRAERLPDRKTDNDGKPIPPPVLLRTYAQHEHLPEGEEACQAAGRRRLGHREDEPDAGAIGLLDLAGSAPSDKDYEIVLAMRKRRSRARSRRRSGS
jgi:hypothetical protein